MSSRLENDRLDLAELDQDLPTTAEDVQALRRLRPRVRLEDLADWNWLSAGWQFALPQRGDTSDGWEPFEL